MVDKLIRRSLMQDKYTFLAINLVFLISIIFATVSVYSLQYGLNNYDHYISETNTEDFQAQTIEPLTNNERQMIRNKYDVVLETSSQYKYQTTNDKQENVEIIIEPYEQSQTITVPVLTAGSYPLESNQVVLSQEFAEANQIVIGDKYQVEGHGYTVSGLASFPQLIYPMQDGSLIPNNKTIGRALINPETYKNEINNRKKGTFYRGKFNQQLNKDKRKEIYYQMQSDLTITVPKQNIVGVKTTDNELMEVPAFNLIIDREDNLNFKVLELEYRFLGIIVAGLSLVVGLITVVLAIFLFKNIVDNQRREIGIMQAEGISTAEITKSYQKYFLVTLIINSSLGIILGVLSILAIEKLFVRFFNIIKYPPSIWLIVSIIIVVIIIVIIVISAVQIFAIRKNINQTVLSLVNKKDSKQKIPKANKFLRKLSFTRRMQLTTIRRNLGKTLLLIYGIFFVTFLLVFGLIMMRAVVNMEGNIRGDNFSYDYIVNFDPNFETDPKLNDENTVVTINGELLAINKYRQDYENISIMAYDPKNEYINFDLPEPLSDNEIVISDSFAQIYNLEENDIIKVGNPLNKAETYEFKVVDIVNVYHEQRIYADKASVQKMLGLDANYYNSLVGKAQTKQIATQGDENAHYYSINDLITGMDSYSKIMNFMILYIATLAGILAFIALTIISTIIIKANKKTISVMKVLGYLPHEINNIILSGYFGVILMVTIISFPLTVKLCKWYVDFILSLVPEMNYPIYVTSEWYDLIIVLIFIILIYLISAKVTINKINKINLSESLKNDD